MAEQLSLHFSNVKPGNGSSTVYSHLEGPTYIFSLQYQDIVRQTVNENTESHHLGVVNSIGADKVATKKGLYSSTSTLWSKRSVGKIITQLTICIKTFLIRHLQYWVYNWTLKTTHGILFIEKPAPALLLSSLVILKLESLVNHLLISCANILSQLYKCDVWLWYQRVTCPVQQPSRRLYLTISCAFWFTVFNQKPPSGKILLL